MSQPASIDTLTARSHAAALRCQASGCAPQAIATLKAELVEIAREVSNRKLSGQDVTRLVLKPIRDSLGKQFEPVIARRLYGYCFDVLWTRSWNNARIVPELPTWYDQHLAQIFANESTRPGPPRI